MKIWQGVRWKNQGVKMKNQGVMVKNQGVKQSYSLTFVQKLKA